jgi:hypothetical protein
LISLVDLIELVSIKKNSAYMSIIMRKNILKMK